MAPEKSGTPFTLILQRSSRSSRGLPWLSGGGVKQLEIFTDSSAACAWLRTMATGDSRLRVSGDGELLIRRRLEIIFSTLAEYGVDWTIAHVSSLENKADPASRVPKEWQKAVAAASATVTVARHAHEDAHQGGWKPQ